MLIKYAILHVLGGAGQASVFSSVELDIAGAGGEYLCRHIERLFGANEAKAGEFYADSAAKKWLEEYLAGNLDFISLSRNFARAFDDALINAEGNAAANFIVVEALEKEIRYIVLLKSDCQKGFANQISQSGGDGTLAAEIAVISSLLPGEGRRFGEYAAINLADFSLSVLPARYKVDGNTLLLLPEAVLECALNHSPKETIRAIERAARKVADDFARDDVRAAAAAKAAIADTLAQDSDGLDGDEALELAAEASLQPAAFGKKVFKEDPALQAAFADELKAQGYEADELVKVNRPAALKKVLHHRLKTDTGIELTIPIDYFDNTEFIEFSRDEAGDLSITIKHIGNIINKG